MNERMITRLVDEIIKFRPKEAQVIPFINKVDLPGGLEKGRKLAPYLLSIDRAKIQRIVLGQAQLCPAVKEICSFSSV